MFKYQREADARRAAQPAPRLKCEHLVLTKGKKELRPCLNNAMVVIVDKATKKPIEHLCGRHSIKVCRTGLASNVILVRME